MKEKNNNKSLFLYTSLIFIVAILLIILAFFGQTNMQKNQPEIEIAEETAPPSSNSGIAERASVLSEENRLLLEEKTKLEAQVREKDAIISGLENENFNLSEQIKMNDFLLQANGYLYVGNFEKSAEALGQVDYEKLTSDQQIIYNNVKNRLN